MILALILASAVLVGYGISHFVPDEIKAGEKWFLLATVLACLPLFFFLTWWQAALIAGAILMGWFLGLIGFAALLGSAVPLAYLVIVLGLLIGTRWRTEQRPFWHLLAATIVLTAGTVVLPWLL